MDVGVILENLFSTFGPGPPPYSRVVCSIRPIRLRRGSTSPIWNQAHEFAIRRPAEGTLEFGALPKCGVPNDLSVTLV